MPDIEDRKLHLALLYAILGVWAAVLFGVLWVVSA